MKTLMKTLMKKVTRKKVIIALSVIALVVAAVITGISIYANQPEVVAIRSVTGVFEQISEREEIALVYNALREGSISFSLKDWINDRGRDELEGGTVSGTLHFSDSAFMVKDFYLDIDDVRLDGDLYFSDELIYLKEREILDGAYGITLPELAEDFKNSIFDYGSDSYYALPKELSDTIMNYKYEDSTQMINDAKGVSEEFFTEVWEIFCENFSFESGNDEIRLGGEKAEARIIHIEITGNAMANFLEDVLVLLEEEKFLDEFIDKYEENLTELLKTLGIDNYGSLREAYEDFLKEFAEEVRIFQKNHKESFESITIKIATPKRSSDLLLLRIDQGSKTLFSLDCGKEGIAESNRIALEICGESFVYEIEKNDEDFCATVNVNKEEVFSFDIDKKRECFTATLGEEDDCYIIDGTFEQDGKTTTISVEKLTERYGYYDSNGIRENSYKTNSTIIIKQKDKMPSAPEDFNKIYDITEKQLDIWVEKLERMF